MPSGGSRRTKQYVQNPEELDSMPTISGGEADGGVGIETSSEGFWTYCLVRLEPPDGIGIVIRKNVHFLHQYSKVNTSEFLSDFLYRNSYALINA